MVARAIRVSILSLTAFIFACGGGGKDSSAPAPAPTPAPAPAQQKPGVLSISSLYRLTPAPTSAQDLADRALDAFNMGYNAGARGQFTSFRWSALEPTRGNYDTQQINDLNGAIANALNHSMVEYVGIQVINTTAREMPAELNGLPFNDPAVRTQFRLLLDRVLTAANRGKIAYLSIGNEVDVYLQAHPAEWAAYKAFYSEAVAYAHALDPSIKVGVTGTSDGALLRTPAELADLNAQSDVMILTYYPIQNVGGNTVVKDPGLVANDFPLMIQFAGAKQLLLQEVGYPAAALNQSSDAMQAQFVRNMFTAWKQSNGKIPFLNYFLLHDFSQPLCDAFGAYYGAGSSASFKAFLCSLGLRKDDGTPRAAWAAFQSEAALAGFP